MKRSLLRASSLAPAWGSPDLSYQTAGGEPPAERSGASASAVAALIRQGPFTGKLPGPLKAGDIVDVDISDSSASNRVDAVELEADPADAVESFFSHLEVYATARAATTRARARIAEIRTLHGATDVNGVPASYCAYGGSWRSAQQQ
jgi:hypothetical protein